MTTWLRAGPTFTLTTDRLAESEACIGDNDLQPAKLAMRVRFPSPPPPGMSQDTIRRCPATSFFFGPAVGSPTSVSATTRSTLTARSSCGTTVGWHHIGIGRRHAGTPVLVFAQDVHVEMMTDRGHPLHDLILDPRPSMSGTPLAVR